MRVRVTQANYEWSVGGLMQWKLEDELKVKRGARDKGEPESGADLDLDQFVTGKVVVIRLSLCTPPLHLVGVSTGVERGCQ